MCLYELTVPCRPDSDQRLHGSHDDRVASFKRGHAIRRESTWFRRAVFDPDIHWIPLQLLSRGQPRMGAVVCSYGNAGPLHIPAWIRTRALLSIHRRPDGLPRRYVQPHGQEAAFVSTALFHGPSQLRRVSHSCPADPDCTRLDAVWLVGSSAVARTG